MSSDRGTNATSRRDHETRYRHVHHCTQCEGLVLDLATIRDQSSSTDKREPIVCTLSGDSVVRGALNGCKFYQWCQQQVETWARPYILKSPESGEYSIVICINAPQKYDIVQSCEFLLRYGDQEWRMGKLHPATDRGNAEDFSMLVYPLTNYLYR
jgi:hypothetical protein